MTSDVWFFVRADGKIIKRVENDGYAYLRNGPQAVDTVVTPEYVQQHYPRYWENYLRKEFEGDA